MKNDFDMELKNGKHVVLSFSIRTLRQLEKALGTSIIALYLTREDKAFTIDTIVQGLKFGSEDVADDEAAYDLIQAHCDAGGSIADIGAGVMKAVLATGLFDNRKNMETDKENKG